MKNIQNIKIPTIDFIGKRNISMLISAILMVVSIASLSVQGLKFGIDFTGGTLIEIGSQTSINLDEIRTKLTDNNFESFNVSHFGSDKEVLIFMQPSESLNNATISSQILQIIGDTFSMRRVEFVGPKVGEELTNDGGLAMLYALIGILIYVALRFEYRFGIGSVAALIHDVIITLGIFSITGIQFDLTVLAAILAVIGYSLNDTVVVFDRIRENFLNTRKDDSRIIVNDALNQTLSRTIMTSVTTLLVLVALFFFGGEIINGFALALIIGVLVGTYSSIFVASSTILAMGITKEHVLPSEKEQQEIDARP
jgi:preprotein translocase subunit SecF